MENFVISVISNEKDPQNMAKAVSYDINDNGTLKIGAKDYADLTVSEKATFDAFVSMLKATS